MILKAADELSKGSLKLDSQVQKQLESLQKKNSKKDFLRLISTQLYYGCVHFRSCVCDYPEAETRACVSLGNRNMYFRMVITSHIGRIQSI